MKLNHLSGLGVQVASAGFAIVLVYLLLLSNIRVFIADDAYFYLVTVRNMVLEGKHSFSGIFPSNGFHPFWLYLLAIWGYCVSLINPDWLFSPYYPLPLSLILVSGAILNFLQVARRLNIRSGLFVAIPAVYLTAFGVLYSEAHVLYFSISLLWRLSLSERLNGRACHPFIVGIAAFLVFFSRLDTVFFVAAFYAWLWSGGKSIQFVLKALVPPFILGTVYLVFNQVNFGGLSPISGWLKSSFPVPTFSGLVYQGDLPTIFSGYSIPFGWIPILFSFGVYALLRKRNPRKTKVLLCFCIGALGQGLYVAAFTTGYTYWYWYYVLPVFAAALGVAVLADRYLVNKSFHKTAVIILILGGISILLISKHGGIRSQQTQWLMELVEKYEINNKTILVSEHPGYVAFYSDNRIIAADMLTGNRKLFGEMVDSDNALASLFAAAEAEGYPVDYVAWVAGRFLFLADDQRTLIYPSPKYPNPEIGRMLMPSDPLEVNEKGFSAWKLR